MRFGVNVVGCSVFVLSHIFFHSRGVRAGLSLVGSAVDNAGYACIYILLEVFWGSQHPEALKLLIERCCFAGGCSFRWCVYLFVCCDPENKQPQVAFGTERRGTILLAVLATTL